MKMDEKPRLNTNNSSSKMSSVVFMSRGKTIADIYDGEYFEVVSKQENLLVVRCKICGPEGPQLRTSTKSNGNILKHIQRRHANMLNKIKSEKNIKSRMSRFETRHSRPQPIEDANLMEDESIYIENTDQSEQIPTVHEVQSPQHPQRSDQSAEAKTITLHYEINENREDNQVNVNHIEPEMIATSIQFQLANQVHKYESYSDKAADVLSETDSIYQNAPYDDHSESQRRDHTATNDATTSSSHYNKELIDLRKELIQREYDEIQAQRLEKHRLEMEILRAELQHKEEEHRKRMELFDQNCKKT